MVYAMILFAHLLATAVMFGIIWFVQIIHYPLMAMVKEENFSFYEKEHVRLTAFLIMPAMLIELISAILLLFISPEVLDFFFWINIALLSGIWLSTFLIQVPLHSKLSDKKGDSDIIKLVNSNWIRTTLWTARLILLFWIVIFI